MKSTLPIQRSFLLGAILIACCHPHMAGAEALLTIDEELQESGQAARLPPLSATESTLQELPLSLALSRKLQGMPPEAIPATSGSGDHKPVPASGLLHDEFAGAGEWIRGSLAIAWALTALLLCLHVLREWLRVMRIRIRRPDRSIALEHAPWPTVAVLLPLNGETSIQAGLLHSLVMHDFDYPATRIHFIPLFDPADREITRAVADFTQALPERVHALPMMSGRNTTLAAALHAANAASIGTALVVYDQEGLPPRDWLRQSITPLLDPAVGAVLTRVVPPSPEGSLQARMSLLADHADTLIATQADALSLLLCGKARIRALRRQAVKALDAPDLALAPDGASIVQALTRLGWQSHLLGGVLICGARHLPDMILSPRMRLSVAWRSVRMATMLLNPAIPRGCRRQVGAAFFSAALPIIWLCSLLLSMALYLLGEPMLAALGIALCVATSFDPHGQPGPAFGIAAAARMAGLRSEIMLLPLTSLGFLDRICAGIRGLLMAHREREAVRAMPVHRPLATSDATGDQGS